MNIEELEKKIQVLEDIEEIKKVQAHYVNSLLLAQFEDI